MVMEEAVKRYQSFDKWAVLGVTREKEKFGNIIYHQLKDDGKTVFGINPVFSEIDGDMMYEDIEQVPEPVDVVVFVVNPRIGVKELEKINRLGIQNIWLQPGTISGEFLEKVMSLRLDYSDRCVLKTLAAGKNDFE